MTVNQEGLPSLYSIQAAEPSELSALLEIESICFNNDRLSKRQFNHWLQAKNKVFLTLHYEGQTVGYGLIIMRRGTRMARLYSIAILSEHRGKGVSRYLLQALERETLQFDKIFIRLEVAENNYPAIGFYQSMGYKKFGTYTKYYEDDTDALRMQKDIRQAYISPLLPKFPWYQQTTEFTCGPAALMMVMASLGTELSQELELDLWREATTIFMMSGHGGCHPIGLALCAQRRSIKPTVYINQPTPLFTNGVRSQHKKQVIACVEEQFTEQAKNLKIPVIYRPISLPIIEKALANGQYVLSLISTYQLDGHKVPHWVVITAVDDHCIYLHDPCLEVEHQTALDCQHVPISKNDFDRLSCYGKDKLRAAVILEGAASTAIT